MQAQRDPTARERHVVQALLRTGLVVATVLMLIGFSLSFSEGLGEYAVVRLFDIFDVQTKGLLLMTLGILSLALTPALRVLSLLFLWIREGDRRFASVAFIVVCVLVAALLLGKG